MIVYTEIVLIMLKMVNTHENLFSQLRLSIKLEIEKNT